MRATWALLFGLMLASPSIALAEAAHQESEHEAAEHADTHGGHGELHFKDVVSLSNTEFWGTIVNFTVLILLLGWVVKKKGNPALAARRAEIEAELAEAQRLRAEAEKRHMETATRLEKLDKEMLSLRADMIKAGEAERDRMVAQAEEKAARIRRDANFLIEQQIKQLRKELSEQAAIAAVAAAQDLLSEQTPDIDQKRLAEAYLARLDEVVEERGS